MQEKDNEARDQRSQSIQELIDTINGHGFEIEDIELLKVIAWQMLKHYSLFFQLLPLDWLFI